MKPRGRPESLRAANTMLCSVCHVRSLYWLSSGVRGGASWSEQPVLLMISLNVEFTSERSWSVMSLGGSR